MENPQWPHFTLVFLTYPGDQSTSVHVELTRSWEQGARAYIVLCCTDAPWFISPVPDSWHLESSWDFCFFKLCCCEFPPARIISHICKPIYKVHSYKWIHGANVWATVYFDSYWEMAFHGQCTDLYPPLPRRPAWLLTPAYCPCDSPF